MKIIDLHIERFGVWNDLKLTLKESGLNVVYGPNEAGKSTLMRFIRSVLYGRQWTDIDLPASLRRHAPWAGSLKVSHHDRHYEIRRSAQPREAGELAVHGFDREAPAGELLDELTAGANETLFDCVFSVGLNELQELATLHEDEVARHIYGLSLGPEGQRLLDVVGDIEAERGRLLDAVQGEGLLAELFERYEHVSSEIQSQDQNRQTYVELLHDRQGLEAKIAEFKSRQEGLKSQLRGHVFLDTVWGPWNRVRTCEDELDGLPVVWAFPEDGLARLTELDEEFDTADRCRDALLKEAAQLRKDAEALDLDPELQKHASGVQGFLDQREHLEELERQSAAAESDVEAKRADLDQALSGLGADWSLERLTAVETSHTALLRLVAKARGYQSALARRAKLRKRYKHRSDRCHTRGVELHERCRPLGGLSIADALAAVRQRIAELEELARLQRSESDRANEQAALEERLERLQSVLAPPAWINGVLWSAVGLGLLLAGVGFYAGLTVNAVAGLMYALLGATFIGFSWAFKRQTAGPDQDQPETLQRRLDEVAAQLAQTRDAIARLDHCRSPLFPGLLDQAEGGRRETAGAVGWTILSDTEQAGDGRREAVGRTILSDKDDVDSPNEAMKEDEDAEETDRIVHPTSEETDRIVHPTSEETDRIGHPTSGTTDRIVHPTSGTTDRIGHATSEETDRIGHPTGASHAVENGSGDTESAVAADIAELIARAARQLAVLEQLARDEQAIRSTRRKLTAVRGRFQQLQREVSTARQNWCELLVQLGLNETVRINETFDTWRRIVDADERRKQWETARRDRSRLQELHESFRRRVMELGHRMNQWDHDYQHPLSVLDAWEEQLKTFADNRKERQRLAGEIKARQREAGQYRDALDEIKLKRSALLVQAGAATAEEFEQRAEWFFRRQELEEQLSAARDELETAAQSEPELAIVEEDLQDHDPGENSQFIATLQMELDDVASDLQAAFEELGSVKQELRALEADRRSTQLRFEREQITTALKRAAERWFAVQWASRAIERTRSEFERTCQPETLAAASHWLRRLTCGKYVNVWTPLGGRQLCIEDDHGHTRGVSQLSGGTREQLFLAIRLALLDRFSREGVELPLVLDDVIVNFDQLRTEAAVDTLLELAGSGKQLLLFTCHLHLAHLFESKGIEPLWLPGHHSPMEERLAG